MDSAPPTPKPKRRVWRWVLLALACVLVVYFLIAPLVQTAYLRATLPGATESARAAAEPDAAAQRAARLAETGRILGLSGEPVYSASFDVCYTDHSDAGWFATNYNHRCQLSYVDVLAVPAGNAAVRAALDKAAASGKSPVYSMPVWSVDYLKAAGRPPAPRDSPRVRLNVPTPEAYPDVRRALTDSVIVLDVVAYAASEAFANRRLLAESGSTALEQGQEYLIVSDSQRYFNRDIGCAIGRPPFCSSPLGGD